jgi:hypothetical protein
MREGRLFRMEYSAVGQDSAAEFGEAGKRPARKIEHFWLCGACSTSMTLIMSDGKVETVVLPPSRLRSAAS